MAAPLTNRQKAYLAMLGSRCLKRALDSKESIPDCGCGNGADTAYRHNQVISACQRHGLRCCTQDHYGMIKAHFLKLLGDDGGALKADFHGRPELNQRRVAEHQILKRCREYGIPLAKAEGICRQMTRGRGLQEVEETATLWNVFFKLRFYEPAGVKRET